MSNNEISLMTWNVAQILLNFTFLYSASTCISTELNYFLFCLIDFFWYYVLQWTFYAFVIFLSCLYPFQYWPHTHESDFINLSPTLPRKSNFLQLSKGYSGNIYRVEIKLESWNLNNYESSDLEYQIHTPSHVSISDTIYEPAYALRHTFFSIFAVLLWIH